MPYLKPGGPKLWLGEYAAKTPAPQWPIGEAWLDGISIAYLLDSPQAKQVKYLTKADLARVGISEPELRESAIEALWDRVETSLQVLSIDNDCFGLRLDGTFESSTLLLTELWSNDLGASLAGGELALAAPTRDVVLYGSASHPYSIRHLRSVVEKLWTSPATDHLLSRKLFRWNRKARTWELYRGSA